MDYKGPAKLGKAEICPEPGFYQGDKSGGLYGADSASITNVNKIDLK